MIINKKKIYVFDLDDTIYPEFEYKKSGLNEISNLIARLFKVKKSKINQIINEKGDAFNDISKYLNIPSMKESLIWLYRLHCPKIKLKKNIIKTLEKIKENGDEIIFLTDGRSITQRLKLESLGLLKYKHYISEDYSSEKPNILRYKMINDDYPHDDLLYIADNPIKDFVAPNKLNWLTVLIKQNWKTVHQQKIPKKKIINQNLLLIIYMKFLG